MPRNSKSKHGSKKSPTARPFHQQLASGDFSSDKANESLPVGFDDFVHGDVGIAVAGFTIAFMLQI